jgi:hypothetical protein
MNCTEILKARVSAEIKLRVKVVADRELLTEAAWVKRLVIREIQAADVAGSFVRELGAGGSRRPSGAARGANRCVKRVYVRLRDDDRLLLEARAAARGMRPATYLSVLTRAHLRELIPLPKEELLALKRSIGELGSIGRNINQIAKAANEGGTIPRRY